MLIEITTRTRCAADESIEFQVNECLAQNNLYMFKLKAVFED